ncbi:heavy metal translocating P-type ATPase [Blastochloris viridis]|uniref:P-type Zn(2+) transporter n=1 Tax=Blastochloris viridis TaxID=1079 RepID=A0A0H5BBK8_BLAVI|nr:heavy metal translocating P-type ATPase [Blastochloris viridis]ALK08945.1 Copper-transporting P-type ATPase [Blastochloris viridis]BAR97656.1 lead, cadmium, zinc and mercury transporting ATPase [Blastochloris viridis]CUU41606.1 Copper-transporting P-type ATPase [Blastochloris viridis]
MTRIAHELRGRLRVRLDRRSAELWTRTAARIEVVRGVSEVRLNPACASLTVAFDGKPETRRAVLKALDEPIAADAVSPAESCGPDLAQVLLSGTVLALAMVLPTPLRAAVTAVNVAGVVLRGVKALTHDGLTVEVLDAIAILLPAVRREYLTANFTRFLLDLGGYIEASTARRSDHLLRDLLRAEPETVTVETPSGEVIELPYDEVVVGTRVVVGTGIRVPVDGVVVDGAAWVNQAAVTGESLPVPREAGEAVLSGSVVEEGRLVVAAERVGDATTTARISRYIREGLADPSGMQSESQRMANRRVLITLASGAAVFLLTRDWRRLESVFLVDYSCAVKFGTPIAIKAAMFRAAKEGCLIKSGRALEAVAAVDTVVFDKTGTLTHNTLEVTDIHRPAAVSLDEEELLALVASLAEHTSHPVAGAVVDLAKRHHLAHIGHEEVSFLVGHGIGSTVHGRTIRIGSRHYLEEHEGVRFDGVDDLIHRLATEGKSLLFVSADGELIGVIGLRDRLRAETPAVLRRLRMQGVKTVAMITGDHEAKARQIGETLGLDLVFHDQKPEDKAKVVEALKAEGRTVAFIGDGVNDGPALMAAHVGIAMPRAADIARATADIVLLEDSLDGVPMLRSLSLESMRLIRSNFAASVAINSAIMAGAALGRLSPVATATLHNGTTIAILLRALASTGAGRAAR